MSLIGANSMRALRASSSSRLILLEAKRFKKTLSTDQYLDPISIIPTYHFQPSLPRLEIPKFDVTLDRYLASTEPLLTADEFKSTKAAVESFREGVGKHLHKELVESDAKNKHTSYISAPWFDMYLSDRTPLPINYNPQITLNDGPHQWTQPQRAAALVASAVRFYRSLRDEVLVPDIFHTKPERSKTALWTNLIRFVPSSISFYGAYLVGAYPLDMSQYKNLIASTRIPVEGKDTLITNPSSRHIIAQYRGHFYKIEVINSDGTAVDQSIVQSSFEGILAENIEPAQDPVGLLTTENRDTWARVRSKLLATDKDNLAAIDGALFVVGLDDIKPTDLAKISRNFLFGDGRNRWFDKSFSLLITGSGKSAINFEHSWGDGVAVVRFMEEIFAASNKFGPLKSTSVKKPERLQWKLSDDVKQAIAKAAKRFDDDVARMDLQVLTTDVMTRSAIKTANVSPDGFLQMSFQLAYYNLHKKTVSTYESASTAAFKHGRTECIRTVSKDSVHFTKVFSNKSSSKEEREAALRQSIKTHSQTTLSAMMGKGIDRHLFALRKIFQQQNPGKELPAIFTDKAYEVLNTNILSTSTLASVALEGGGFGPVTPKGYGVGYGMDEKFLRFIVTSFKPMEVAPFLASLESALKDMKDALVATGKKPEQKPTH